MRGGRGKSASPTMTGSNGQPEAADVAPRGSGGAVIDGLLGEHGIKGQRATALMLRRAMSDGSVRTWGIPPETFDKVPPVMLTAMLAALERGDLRTFSVMVETTRRMACNNVELLARLDELELRAAGAENQTVNIQALGPLKVEFDRGG